MTSSKRGASAGALERCGFEAHADVRVAKAHASSTSRTDTPIAEVPAGDRESDGRWR
ncbi:MAG: hypothetical protein KF850_09085 [Labilithrix sp.]|nr:hypothetical protein [Labilithrix sp.]